MSTVISNFSLSSTDKFVYVKRHLFPSIYGCRYGALSSKSNKMSYYASMSTEGYNVANMAIDKLTVQMKGLLPSSSTTSGENVHHTRGPSTATVKDPVIAATKGSIRQKNKATVKARKCGHCGRPGHTRKTCQDDVKNHISERASNGAATASSTLQPTVYADFVQPSNSDTISGSDGRRQPFTFHNSQVPMPQFSNPLDDNVFSMTNSTPPTYMQPNQWWRLQNFM